MADETTNRPVPGAPGDDAADARQAVPGLDDPQGGWQDAGAAAEAQAERIAALEAELVELKGQRLRDLAEMENVRRRAQRDREDAAKFGASALARDLLTVADNLRRAIEAVPAETRADDQAVASLLSGVELVERELLHAFEKHGITKVDPQLGERFDHNLHQAMFEVDNSGQPPGSIAHVMQAGYVMHGRLLRPAMVGVAKAEAGEAEPQRVDRMA